MNQNNHAIIIGFDKYKDYDTFHDLNYAGKDAEDLYKVLTHPEYGQFDPKNVILINDKNPLSTEGIEERLFIDVVRDRGPEDTILVYYSGHGIVAHERRRAFLATPDVSLLSILANPKAGLGMSELYDDYFLESKAGNVIFILDCCFSGNFGIPSEEHEREPSARQEVDYRRLLVDERYFRGDGRVAFVSTSSRGVSRESHEFQNGIFTYFLLNGLKGACTERSGEVSLTTLAAYVQSMMPKTSEQPLLIGRPARVVLTKPGVKIMEEELLVDRVFTGFSRPEQRPRHNLPLQALENPVSRYIQRIKRLIAALKNLDQSENRPLSRRILNAVQESLDCDFVFVRRLNAAKGDITKFHSDFAIEGIPVETYEENVLQKIYPYLVRSKDDLLPVRYGFYDRLENLKGPADKPYLVVVPLVLEDTKEFVVFCGVGESELAFGEMLGHMIHSLYRSTNEFTTFNALLVESAFYDDLKRGFSNVPHELYMERFSMFTERLHQVFFTFEPVAHIGVNEIEIDSWEALAREGDQTHAPVGLFKAAELWGPHFITELDIYCLRTAITTYVNVWKKERPGQKKDPLSVNVYPESLFRRAYKAELKKIIKEEGLLFGDKLVLEISEKRNLSDLDIEGLSSLDQAKLFEKKLKELARELNISFAIDDFGVEHSSVSRMAHLELAHVKIDRDILLHPYPAKTINYVRDLVSESHSHTVKVVMEGFDEDIHNISLADLYHIGIDYIQGHLIRRASPSVSPLSKDKIDLLYKLMRG